MSERVALSLNVGSSSLKFALFTFSAESEVRLTGGEIERTSDTFEEAIATVFETLSARRHPEPDVVGHRLVHGGPNHFQPERVDTKLLAALREATPFAPLHLPIELGAIEVVAARFPRLPQVACFDTAFHASLPEVARRLPLPRALFDQGIRRYGFHGLSYEYVVAKIGAASLGRAVIAHLGSGVSLAAVKDGMSVDTTMGLTPTGGIMMGTRTGDLDPGVVLYLLNQGYDADRLEKTIDHASGLLGASGVSADMKTLLAHRATDPHAALAVDMFAYQIRKSIGAFAAALGGIDTLVFTGGIGERAALVRELCCSRLAHLGIQLDAKKNVASESIISEAKSACSVRVLPTDEEIVIARHALDLLPE